MKLSQDLLEKVSLLVLTALLTGLLIPYVLKSVDEARRTEQKLLEADLARQSKLIEAQAEFLDELTDTLWSLRYLTIRVAYYGQNAQDKYVAAVSDYENQIWDVLFELRKQTSKSRRLVSEKTYKRLVELYDRIVGELDSELREAIAKLDRAERVAALAKLNERLRWQETKNLDDVIDTIAAEVGLKKQAETNEDAAQPALASGAPLKRSVRPQALTHGRYQSYARINRASSVRWRRICR